MKSIKEQAKSVVYSTIDLCVRGRGIKRTICGESFRLPARICRYYPSDYEPDTFAFLRTYCKPGQTVLDIGAHIGLFSVEMARLVGPSGHVFSFEPTPHIRNLLQKIVQMNGCTSHVEVRSEAMAQNAGTATFYDTGSENSNANSLVHTQRSANGFTVETISLDDFVAARALSVDCLKIDVEGAELDVLRGAAQTFLNCRPVVSLALHPDALSQDGTSLRAYPNRH